METTSHYILISNVRKFPGYLELERISVPSPHVDVPGPSDAGMGVGQKLGGTLRVPGRWTPPTIPSHIRSRVRSQNPKVEAIIEKMMIQMMNITMVTTSATTPRMNPAFP